MSGIQFCDKPGCQHFRDIISHQFSMVEGDRIAHARPLCEVSVWGRLP